MEANCLNCNHSAAQNYCPNCGQKNSTHRYSLKHFFEHDFVHGVWHVDKGVLFTVKELFTRPGNSVREYVQGKRVNYFSFVTLILLIMGVSSVLGHYSHVKLTDLVPESSRAVMTPLEQFISKYPKIVLLITIPLYSFFSFIFFRKSGYNYSEHLVLNSYKTSAELLVGLLFTVVTIFYTNVKGLMLINYLVVSGFGIFYTIWFYYQFFSESGYSKRALILRSIFVPISYLFLSMLAGVLWAIIERLK